MTRILCLSNGHGEDLNGSLVLQALHRLEPDIELAALPLVGLGNSYRNINVSTLEPTKSMPSGGFIYMDRSKLWEDLRAGLIGLTLGQLKTIFAVRHRYDLVLAVGDTLPQLFAYLTGRPYVCCAVATSAYYDGHLDINPFMRSPRCLKIFTRDAYSAEYLRKRGMDKALFAGNPFMDALHPASPELFLRPAVPLVALLPGSRPPEATQNFLLLLDLCVQTAQVFEAPAVQFRAALVPSMMPMLGEIAAQAGWNYLGQGKLQHPATQVAIVCFDRAFADILHACDLVVGLAGTAIEQAVGLGKPVIQIVGKGPQFTYRFAEAQMRLLGDSVQTIGKIPATSAILADAARVIKATLNNTTYLEQCRRQGTARVGSAGGSLAIARNLVSIAKNLSH